MNLNRDIAFKRNDEWFRFRVCAIIMHVGKVLMATSNKIGFYYAVGGGVEHNESTEDAVKREVFEETGVHMEIDRLAFINENFFLGLEFAFGKKLHCHELAFYYLMKYDPSMPINLENVVTEDGSIEHLEWIDLEDYPNVEAYPKFFAKELHNLDPGVKHLVTREE